MNIDGWMDGWMYLPQTRSIQRYPGQMATQLFLSSKLLQRAMPTSAVPLQCRNGCDTLLI